MKTHGFTLLELIITLAVAAILVTIGIPSFVETLRNNRLVTQTNELVATLNLARTEAIKRGVPVTICKASYTTATAPTACSTSASWNSGWIVYADRGSVNGTISSTDGDEIILVKEAMASGFKLGTGNNFKDWFSYLATGYSKGGGSGGLGNDTFTLCLDGKTTTGRAIAVNTAGRVTVSKGVSTCP